MMDTVGRVSFITKCSRARKSGVGGVTNFPPQRDLRLDSLEARECGLDGFLKCYSHQGISGSRIRGSYYLGQVKSEG